MTTADELQALVERRYELLDAPSWDDPHASRDPRDDEYSRVTDPERYRVTHLRGRVWAEVLAERLAVQVEAVESLESLADPEHPSRVVVGARRLVPSSSGARPLLLVEVEVADGEEQPLRGLDVGVDRPGLVSSSHPHCGCDACDDGSEALLDGIDRSVLDVVAGPSVMRRGADGEPRWRRSGGWGVPDA